MAETRAEGRAIAALVVAGDADALVERFTPALARQLPRATVEQALEQTLAGAPIGPAVGESVLPLAVDRRGYLADHRWGAGRLGLTVELDREGAIAGINLVPRRALPRDPTRDAGRGHGSGSRSAASGGCSGAARPSGRTTTSSLPTSAMPTTSSRGARAGRTAGAGARNADYWAWGRPIVAPAGGVVVAAVDGVRDNRPQLEVENRRAPAGNHVVLDLGNGEYALLAHLRRGSVRVEAGQRVRAGEVLGLAGNSATRRSRTCTSSSRTGRSCSARPAGCRSSSAATRPTAVARRGTPVQGQFVRDVS